MYEEELSEGDEKWELCRLANRTYRGIWRALASNPTQNPWYVLGVTRRTFRTADDGHWRMFHSWIKVFVPKWEQQFRTTMDELEEGTADVNVASKALNVAPELLSYFVQHRAEIEDFLEAQRPMLGAIAETKLWELIMQGDPATVRWFLERTKSSIYGRPDKSAVPDTEPETVEIIRG